MRLYVLALAVMIASLPFLAGCTGCSRQEKSPEQIRQDTANATAKLKRDSVAVAQGIKEGLSNKRVLDLNTASKADLASLPGLNDAAAGRIIASRPFDNKDQLVTKKVLSQAQYDQVEDRVTVTK